MSILVVGSVALDSVETPFGIRERVLGGSATYFATSASFFTDVNLVALPPLFGFGGHIAKGELARIHDSKIKRLPEVRKLMTQMLLAASGTLVSLQPDESILLHLNFYSLELEDRTGLPKSMSVQGKKRDLLDAAARKLPVDSVSGMLKVRVE